MIQKTKILNLVIALVAGASFMAVSTESAYAKRQCFTQYGGGETCINVNEDAELNVDKVIKNPKTGEYVDHVRSKNASDAYVFGYQETLKFRIIVENKGDVTIKNVDLKDIMPSLIKYKGGDGNDENNGRTVKFDVGDLKSGERKTYEFEAKFVTDGIVPNDDIYCDTNYAKAEGRRKDNDKKIDNADATNFCVALPKVLSKEAPTKLPVTGGVEPKSILVISFASGLILVGFGIKKYFS